MLETIEQTGPAGLSTNKASLQVFNSRTYGWRILKQAEELGYIERIQVPRKEGGHPYTMNFLTDKGCKLLQDLMMDGHVSNG